MNQSFGNETHIDKFRLIVNNLIPQPVNKLSELNNKRVNTEVAAHPYCVAIIKITSSCSKIFFKIGVLKILQYSEESSCVGVSFS